MTMKDLYSFGVFRDNIVNDHIDSYSFRHVPYPLAGAIYQRHSS